MRITAPKNNGEHQSGYRYTEALFRLFPLMFILCILPLIVRVYPHNSGLAQFAWYSTDDLQFDFFLHCKSVALTVMGIYMLIMLCAYALAGALPKRKPVFLIPLGIFAALALLSSVVSPYRSFAFSGITEGFESIWVTLCYCLLVVYAFYMLNSVTDIRILLYSFSLGVFLLTIVGVMQAYGHNPLNIPWINDLTIPGEYLEALTGNVIYEDNTYLTLYNTNYAGVYMTMTVPVMLFLMLDFNRKKFFSSVLNTIGMILNKIIYIVLFLCSLYCMYISKSEAGMLSLCAVFIFIPVVMYRRLWAHKLITLGGIAVLSVLLLTCGKGYVTSVFDLLVTSLTPSASTSDLKDIHVGEEGVTFTYKDVKMTFRMWEADEDMWVYSAFDENGEMIMPSSATIFYYYDEPYSDFSVTYAPVDNRLAMNIVVGDEQWIFSCYKDEGHYQLFNVFDRWTDMPDIEHFAPLDGYENIVSHRGYIWNRTLALLKNYAVLGIGADCFTFAFPQTDYIGRLHAGYRFTTYFNKPHSLYLQIAVQYGIPALIAFLVFFGMYFVQSFSLYSRKKLNSFEAKTGFAIFLSMTAYMITGLANDSMIVVSPLFWTLIGMGFVLNRMVKEKVTNTVPEETPVEEAVAAAPVDELPEVSLEEKE